jgi:hypothetical protein
MNSSAQCCLICRAERRHSRAYVFEHPAARTSVRYDQSHQRHRKRVLETTILVISSFTLV